jgi:hypothetical protein
MLKKMFLLVFISALGVIPVFAQPAAEAGEQASVREDLWVCPVFEAGMYGISSMAVGGGAALGYGDRVSFGLKVVYWNELEEVRSLELNFLARFYFFRMMERSGLFIQFNGGPVFFARYEKSIAVPPEVGTISAGLSLGWRFLLGSHFFVEPAVRTGYPYIAGAGLSAGVRF